MVELQDIASILINKYRQYYLLVAGILVVTYMCLLFSKVEDDGKYPYHTRECAECTLYDVSEQIDEDFNCVRANYLPPIMICVYPPHQDMYISQSLVSNDLWEGDLAKKFSRWLLEDPRVGVIDMGANLGLYSLIAASMGHDVLAVEPNLASVRRFHKSVQLGSLQERVTLMRNAVGDRRGVVNVAYSKDNQGDTRVSVHGRQKRDTVNMIVMNDLLRYCTFNRAILKIDIQGYEHKAFVHAGVLFSALDISHVIMEWREIRYMARTLALGEFDVLQVENMIHFLTRRRYDPIDRLGNRLDYSQWRTWPDDVIWMR